MDAKKAVKVSSSASPARKSDRLVNVEALLLEGLRQPLGPQTLAYLQQLLLEATKADEAGRPWLSAGQLKLLGGYVAAYVAFRQAQGQALIAFSLASG